MSGRIHTPRGSTIRKPAVDPTTVLRLPKARAQMLRVFDSVVKTLKLYGVTNKELTDRI